MSKYVEQMLAEGKSYKEIASLQWKTYNELLEEIKNEPEKICVPSPFSGLNTMTGGYEPGRLYVLGAPPKQGKTLFAMSSIYQQAKLGAQSLLFSYEVGWKNVVKTFRDMEISDNREPGSIQMPIYIPIELHRDSGQLQLQWLREAITHAKEIGVDFVVIDYLHFLIPYQVTQNFSIVVGNVVREIKRIALDTDMPIFLIVAMKKLESTRKPTMWDIRDSSMIMHEADDVMIMYRLRESEIQSMVPGSSSRPSNKTNSADDPYTPYSVLSLEISRKNGASGGIYLSYNGSYFEEIEKDLVIANFTHRYGENA